MPNRELSRSTLFSRRCAGAGVACFRAWRSAGVGIGLDLLLLGEPFLLARRLQESRETNKHVPQQQGDEGEQHRHDEIAIVIFIRHVRSDRVSWLFGWRLGPASLRQFAVDALYCSAKIVRQLREPMI